MLVYRRSRAIEEWRTKAALESLESRLFLSATPDSIIHHTFRKASVAASPAVTGSGLTAEYYKDAYFSTPVVVRTEKQINFNYKSGRPDLDLPAGVFTASWTGAIVPSTSGTYTFYTNSNSGTRVIINGTTVLDNFTNTSNSVAQGNIALTAGQSYTIAVQYVSPEKGAAKLQLIWSTDGIAKQVVPKSVLFPDTTVALPAEPLLGTYYLGGDFQTQIMTRGFEDSIRLAKRQPRPGHPLFHAILCPLDRPNHRARFGGVPIPIHHR